jgi:hypothetical protein
MGDWWRYVVAVILFISTPGNMFFAMYWMQKERQLASLAYCFVTVLGIVGLVRLLR